MSPLPGQPLKPKTVGQPSLGIDVDIVDESGTSVVEDKTAGYLVVRASCPSMTKALWEGKRRYLDEYWSTWDGLWDHGDWAERDSEGFWYIHGRADENINVAGRKVGPGEIENALLQNPLVAEAAVVGVPDERKGEAIVAYVVVFSEAEPGDQFADTLREQVGEFFGKPFRPREIEFVDHVPKNQSGKILRTELRQQHPR